MTIEIKVPATKRYIPVGYQCRTDLASEQNFRCPFFYTLHLCVLRKENKDFTYIFKKAMNPKNIASFRKKVDQPDNLQISPNEALAFLTENYVNSNTQT